MAEGSPLDKLPNTDKLDPTQSVQPGQGSNAPETGKFAEHMKPDQTQPQNVNNPNQPTPMEAAQALNKPPGAPPTMESIQGQMNSTSGRLGDVKKKLHTKGLKLKQSDKYLLRNKLKQANEHLRSTAQHLGADPGPPVDLKKSKNPLNKFLAMVSDGQHQLSSAAEKLKQLNSTGKSVNAAEMLLVQVKLQKAQQELDYTSVILGKAVEMIRTLLNVQI